MSKLFLNHPSQFATWNGRKSRNSPMLQCPLPDNNDRFKYYSSSPIMSLGWTQFKMKT